MATSDAESDAEQHMEPCNDAYFKLIGVLGAVQKQANQLREAIQM
jgi:hypothetical protein